MNGKDVQRWSKSEDLPRLEIFEGFRGLELEETDTTFDGFVYLLFLSCENCLII
jgi:hypothetical protein